MHTKKKLTRRAVGTLLSLLMVTGMVAMLGAVPTHAASPEIVFAAPENIYLAPGTGGTAVWQYFYDKRPSAYGVLNPTWALNAASQTDGMLYLYAPGASQVRIVREDADTDVRLWTTGPGSSTGDANAVNNGAWIGGDTAIFYIANTASSTNASRLVRWRAEYTVSGTTYTAYAYSYVYKPYLGVYGVGGYIWGSGNNSTNRNIHNTAGIWGYGVHSITPIDIGTAMPNSISASGAGSAILSGTLFLTNLTNTASPGGGGSLTNGNGPDTDARRGFYTRMSDTDPNRDGARGIRHYYYSPGNNFGTGAKVNPDVYESAYGKLWVDTSRYANASQIPNFKWNTANFFQGRGSPDVSPAWKDEWTRVRGYKVGPGVQEGDSGYVFTIPQASYESQSSGASWLNESHRDTVDFRSAYFPLWSTTELKLRSRVSVGVGSNAIIGSFSASAVQDTNLVTEIVRVDKTDLRNKLQAEINRGLQQGDNAVIDWAEYQNYIKKLAQAVCQPDYALSLAENNALLHYAQGTNMAVRYIPDTVNGGVTGAYIYNEIQDIGNVMSRAQVPSWGSTQAGYWVNDGAHDWSTGPQWKAEKLNSTLTDTQLLTAFGASTAGTGLYRYKYEVGDSRPEAAWLNEPTQAYSNHWYTFSAAGGTANVGGTGFNTVKVALSTQGGDPVPERMYGVGTAIDTADISKPTDGGTVKYGTGKVLPTPVRAGYDFRGWFAGALAGAKVEDSTVVTNTAAHTIFAHWRGKPYKVAFDPNSGAFADPADAERIVNYDSVYGNVYYPDDDGCPDWAHDEMEAVPLPTPTRAQYAFAGWNTQADGLGATIVDGSYVRVDGGVNPAVDPPATNITLYAKWDYVPHQVTYTANGGVGTDYVDGGTYAVDYDVLGNDTTNFTKANYTFDGWNTKADGNGTDYFKDDIIVADGAAGLTLYAQWKGDPYDVEYDANGGTPASYTHSGGGAYGEDYEVLAVGDTGFTNAGYDFDGWNTQADYLGTDYDEADIIDADGAFGLKLYAKWDLNFYTITYDGNTPGGTVDDVPAAGRKYHGTDYPLVLTPAPTCEGWVFLGWDTNGGANTPAYPADGSVPDYTTEASATLYAIWTRQTYAVTYDGNTPGGTVNDLPPAGAKIHDTDFTPVTSPAPTCTGWVFLGWDEEDDADPPTYTDGGAAKYTENETVTLYAIWAPATYTIAYDANSGGGAPGSQTKTHGVKLVLDTAEPTRANYNFLGWAADDDTAATPDYAPGDDYTADADVTLYAVWAIKTYTVKYNANGGGGVPANQTKDHGATLVLDDTVKPTWEGRNFQGWAFSNSASTPDYALVGVPWEYTADADATLYAVWKLKTYTIEYDANGGDIASVPGDDTKTYGVTLVLSTTVPTRTGYSFLGWNEDNAATTAAYAAGGNYTANVNATLFAVWKANTYTIEYDANGGTGEPNYQTKTFGVALPLSSTEPTRPGHDFQGWGTSSTATTVAYAPGANYDANVDAKLYAVWKIKTYTITYDANGGDIASVPGDQTKDYGDTLTLDSTEPTRTGYDFQGWNEDNAATTAAYAAGGNYTADADATLYAVWKLDPAATYTITYDDNGGTGAPANQTKTHDVALTLSTTVPTRTGYSFLGWNEDNAATTAAYAPGANYTDNAGLALYAVWEINTYAVTYNANGGDGAPGGQTKTFGVALTLSSTEPTRTGHAFKGWGTSSTATTVAYAPGASYTADAGAALYAIWEINTYTVTYDDNDGTGAPANQTKTHDVALTLSTTEPTRTGYDFQGWATSSTATAVEYAPGASYTDNAGLALYAVWNVKTYTVTYNGNGGSGAPDSQTKTHDAVLTLSSTVPTRANYTFLGWSTNNTATVEEYAAGDTYTANADAALYAVWEINTYAVTYDANGGAGEPAEQTKTYGVALTLSATVPTRTGYAFQGWGTSSTATAAAYAAGATYTANAGATLYAVWKADIYVVTYDANGGAGAPIDQIKTHDVDLTLRTTVPTRTGHTFLGWADSSAAMAADYAAGGIYTDNAGVTLFAVWDVVAAPATYTISYDANGGAGAPANQTKTHDVALALSTTRPTRSGYTFQGWATSSTAAAAAYAAGGNYTANADAALYAVWKAVTTPPPPTGGGGGITTYTLTVTNGTGSGTYGAGAAVAIAAAPAPSGKVFDKWTATSGSFADANNPNTNFTMPAAAARVTANYKDALPPGGGGGGGGGGNEVDKSALIARIKQVGGTLKGDYTDETWDAFQKALAAGQAVVNDPRATQQQVNGALLVLNRDYEELLENPPLPPLQPPVVIGSADVKLKYRASLALAVTGEGITWSGGNKYVSVDPQTGQITSLKGFIKTGSATITAQNSAGSVDFKVKVMPSFWQWLLIVILFGWIWM